MQVIFRTILPAGDPNANFSFDMRYRISKGLLLFVCYILNGLHFVCFSALIGFARALLKTSLHYLDHGNQNLLYAILRNSF